jgi:DNA mismatch endonuclease (patch repair protein)
MSRIRSSDTYIELAVRRYLFSGGFRYRLNYPLPGKPDIVFPGRRIAVFINGCFWHMHRCRLSRMPSTRRDFWKNKLERNRERDTEVSALLAGQGWTVVTLWECEIRDEIKSSLACLISMLSDDRPSGTDSCEQAGDNLIYCTA